MKKTVLVLTALVLSGTMGITGLAWAQVQLQQFKPSPPKIVFVTSQRYTGNLGGLAGANAKCQQLATAAGLTGTYKAWLADYRSMPTTSFTHSTSPYVLVNGARIADDWTSLITKPLLHELFTDERNTVALYKGYGPEVWTGIYLYHPSGSMSIGYDYYYQSCRGWNSPNQEDSGVAGLNYWTMALPPFTTAWSSYERVPCNQNLRLYCFQQ